VAPRLIAKMPHSTGYPLTIPDRGIPVAELPYREQHTLESIEKMIQQKVAQKNRDAMWAELEHLFKRVPRMDAQQFRKHIRKLGIDLSVEALDALFNKYDRDRSGYIDVYEYCAAVMLGHPKEKCRAYDQKVLLQQQAEARKQKKLEGDSKAAHWADDPVVVEKLVREKISMQTSKNSDMIRQAWYMLGRKKEILPDAFHNVIKNLGISCSARVANELFKKYDDDGNGFLDCYEFVRGLMPKDIDGKTWNVHSEEARAKFDANFKRGANLPHVIPKHLAKWKMPLDELERKVLEKLEQHINTSSKQLGLRQAFRLFSKDGSASISRQDFMRGLRSLGFVLTAEESNALFNKYDLNGDSKLSYREFQAGLFPHEGPVVGPSQTRTLVRPPLVDPTPEFVGDEYKASEHGAAAQAKELADMRYKQSPLYYNTLPTRQEAVRPGRQRAPHVYTPPAGQGFVETLHHHLPSALNPDPKVYGSLMPPKTATRLEPPWASLRYLRKKPSAENKSHRTGRSRSTH